MIEQVRACYDGIATRELFVAGTGPEVLLLHGFADSADTWRPVLRKLADHGRSARAVDLPGYGQAAPMRSGPALGHLDAFVAAFVAARGVAGRTVLVGNSLGSALALRAAATTGVEFGAVVATAAPTAYTRRLKTLRGTHVALPVIARMPVPNAVLSRSVGHVLGRVLYGDPRIADPATVDRFRSQAQDMAAVAGMLRQAKIVTDLIQGAVVADEVRCPVTIVHGGRDAFIPTSAAQRLQAALPDGKLVLLPRIGHCPQLDAPGVVADLVVERLSGPQ